MNDGRSSNPCFHGGNGERDMRVCVCKLNKSAYLKKMFTLDRQWIYSRKLFICVCVT